MNMNVTKNSRSKLLVAVLAMVMVVAGAAVVLSGTDVNATSASTLTPDADDATTITLNANTSVTDLSFPAGVTTVDLNGKTLTVETTSYLPLAVDITSSVAGGKLVTNHVIAVSADVAVSNIEVTATSAQAFEVATGVDFACQGVVFTENEQCSVAVYQNDFTSGEAGNVTVNGCTLNGKVLVYTTDKTADKAKMNIVAPVDEVGLSVGSSSGSSVKPEVEYGKDIIADPETKYSELQLNNSVKFAVGDGQNLFPSKLSGDGDIVILEGGSFYAQDKSDFKGSETNDNTDRLALSDSIIAVYDELPISGTAYIAGDKSTLTIPTGKVLRIMSGGTLDMVGNTLVVEGTLIIETGATVSNGGNIVLMRNGTFDNSGIIGANSPTTITADVTGITSSYNGVGSVTIQNVSGMTFGFVNTTGTNNTPTYTLTLTGDLIAEDTVNSISVNGARIVGDMYVGQDVTLDIQSSDIYSGTVITVDGALASNGKLNMHNGSEVIVNGQVIGAINAVTGDYLSSDGETKFVTDRATYTGTKQTTFTAEATGGFVSGYTLSVGTYGYQYDSDKDGKTEAWTAQRLYLNGTLAYNAPYDATALPTQGTIALTGNGIYVAADVTVIIPNGMTISNTGSPVTVLGTMQFDGRAVPGFDYVGSSYSVKSTGTPSVTTGYVTTFANAMGAIATAEQQKVTVKGDLDIDTEYTLAANQRLDISGAGEVVVKNGGSLTLEARSILTGEVDNVEGVMTIMKPNGSKAPANYSTIAEGTTEAGVSYTRYSGLQYALDNANSGETIAVVGVTEIEGNLTIPAGVTVSGENTISIDGNLVIEETAKLEMVDNNKLDMTGAKSKVTVNGELDLAEGQITFSSNQATTDTAITSTVGKTILASTSLVVGNGPDAINAVAYVDENLQIILTSAEAAIAATSAQDINKEVTVLGNVTAGDVELTVDMVVDDSADATFGTISMADGVAILVDGKLSATVSAQTGVTGSETTSSVVLADAYGIELEAGSSVDSQNVTTYELYIHNAVDGRLVGAVTVSAGTVTIGCDDATTSALTVDKTVGTETSYATLNVNSGATLAVPTGATLNVGEARNGAAAVIVDGTLAVDEGAVAVGYTVISTGYNGNLLINGTMTVANTEEVDIASGSVMTVAGTLDISTVEDEEGLVNVTGTLVVGEKITTMGGSTTGSVSGAVSTDSGIVKVYNGASVAEAVIDDDGNGATGAGSTALYINGNLYATLYSSKATITDSTLENEDFAIVGYDMAVTGGYNIEKLADWYTDAEMTAKVGTTVTEIEIANEDALYFKVNSSVVDVKVSVGSGISLYIDNVRYVSGDTVSLAVGTHSVTASVNPGYTGDVTIQFNGQTVTGEFTITPEMASNTYEGALTITATGDISYETGSTGGDSGMGLTEILLIILVILIVVMAIMVALRLMRS